MKKKEKKSHSLDRPTFGWNPAAVAACWPCVQRMNQRLSAQRMTVWSRIISLWAQSLRIKYLTLHGQRGHGTKRSGVAVWPCTFLFFSFPVPHTKKWSWIERWLFVCVGPVKEKSKRKVRAQQQINDHEMAAQQSLRDHWSNACCAPKFSFFSSLSFYLMVQDSQKLKRK